jgi:glutamate-1-semialdehyde 2,1-aminomutase
VTRPAPGFDPETLAALLARERARFLADHPRSAAREADLKAHWLAGAPMHWMADWACPFPILVEDGEDAVLTDIDDIVYDDFCLGDTPGMFGHGRTEIARALAEQARRGASFMLPTEAAVEVGALLAARFGLPFWQLTLSASDANRAAIRWARALTQKPVLVMFDGAYHGMVDECFVTLDESGAQRMEPGLVGQIHDLAATTRVISFNDIAALEAALAQGDVAAVIAEPAMTNCGMILPEPGFHEALRSLTRNAGALLIVDETHTLSTGPGGATREWRLAPDMFVVGKAVAGGFPAAAWGVTEAIAARIGAHHRPPGRSGIGTTLAGGALAIAAIGAALRELATEAAYAAMHAGAARLEAALGAIIARRGLPWCVVRIGARAELVFAPTPPRNAKSMRAALADQALNEAAHLYLINRGLLIAPFHMMMLISPATSAAQIDRLAAAIDAFAQDLQGDS